jgi:hypothetical protein
MSIIFLACSGQCAEVSRSGFCAIETDAALTFAGAATSKRNIYKTFFTSHTFLPAMCYDNFRYSV